MKTMSISLTQLASRSIRSTTAVLVAALVGIGASAFTSTTATAEPNSVTVHPVAYVQPLASAAHSTLAPTKDSGSADGCDPTMGSCDPTGAVALLKKQTAGATSSQSGGSTDDPTSPQSIGKIAKAVKAVSTVVGAVADAVEPVMGAIGPIAGLASLFLHFVPLPV